MVVKRTEARWTSVPQELNSSPMLYGGSLVENRDKTGGVGVGKDSLSFRMTV
jgi:hypothetical protein